MSLNQKKIVTVIDSQKSEISEKYDDYREDIIVAVSEIIQLEIQNKVSGFHIQQRINDILLKVSEKLNAKTLK
ncbi:MAG: hypothetical protein HOE30_00870 [Deltaproteobacteria bacterium]|jgi:hypothetical protein|nr:hypothetical protein [Deltaproteobacteria bacterium]